MNRGKRSLFKRMAAPSYQRGQLITKWDWTHRLLTLHHIRIQTQKFFPFVNRKCRCFSTVITKQVLFLHSHYFLNIACESVTSTRTVTVIKRFSQMVTSWPPDIPFSNITRKQLGKRKTAAEGTHEMTTTVKPEQKPRSVHLTLHRQQRRPLVRASNTNWTSVVTRQYVVFTSTRELNLRIDWQTNCEK